MCFYVVPGVTLWVLLCGVAAVAELVCFFLELCRNPAGTSHRHVLMRARALLRRPCILVYENRGRKLSLHRI